MLSGGTRTTVELLVSAEPVGLEEVGAFEGTGAGVPVGCFDAGCPVGCFDGGGPVGCFDAGTGGAVGAFVGFTDGGAVGCFVGCCVGLAVAFLKKEQDPMDKS